MPVCPSFYTFAAVAYLNRSEQLFIENMQLVISILLLLCAYIGLYAYCRKSENRVFFLPALMLKLAAGLAYGWLYVVYYAQQGDSFNYFHDASRLVEVGRQDAHAYWQMLLWNEYTPISGIVLSLWEEPRAFWFVKLVSLPMWITGANYWVLACLFSFCSFFGSWVLVEALSRNFPATRLAAVGAFLFLPTVVFFGSGLTKESLAVALLGFATATLLSKIRVSSFFIVAVCAWGLWQLKFYYLALWGGAVSAFAISYFLCQYFKPPVWGEVGIFIAVLVVGIFSTSWVFDFDELVLMIVLNHNTTYIHSHSNDLVHYSIYGGQGFISLEASWKSLSYNAPLALEAGFFRPYIWEAGKDKLKLLMSFENTAILLLSIWALYTLLRKPIRLTTFSRLFVFAGLLYVLGLLTIIALASPNMGGLVRYKVIVSGWIAYGLGCIIISKKKY